MANLKDLIVNGSARVLGTIYGNLTGNVTGRASVADQLKISGDYTGSTASTFYPVWANGTTGDRNCFVTTSKLKFDSYNGILTSTSFSGNFTGGTGFFTNGNFGGALEVKRAAASSDPAIKFTNNDGTRGYIGIGTGASSVAIPKFTESNTANWYPLVRMGKASTAQIGSATKPVYIAENGVATACTYSLSKDVPSNAVFTDTNNAVTQTVKSDSNYYPLLLTGNASQTTTQTAGSNFAAYCGVYPSAGTLALKGSSTTSNIEGAQIDLKPNAGSNTYGGISLDLYNSTFRIFGIPSGDNSTKTGTGTVLEIDPWAKTIKGGYTLTGNVTGSSGSCTGNAATATKATQDGSGNVINSTYVNLTGAQTISGVKTFTGTDNTFENGSYGRGLTIKRTSTSNPVIRYSNNNGIRGYIGVSNAQAPVFTNGDSSVTQNLLRNGSESTAVGSASQPIYANANGVATACTMTTIQATTLFEYVSGSTTNWRRVWSNGWKEEGGYVTKSSNSQSVNFLNGSNSTPGFTNPPTVILTPYYTGESDSRPVYLKAVAKGSFTVYIYSSLTGFYYYACGY